MPVRKVKEGWKVEGTPTIHKTKKEALAQLAAIKISQKKRRKK